MRQWGNTDSAPAGAGTAAAVGKYRKKAPAGAGTAAAVEKYREGSCWSRHCCGSGEIQIALLREQSLLRQWRNIEKAPVGAGTAAAVGRERRRCG